MLIARWQIDARFGQKQTVIDSITQWTRDIAPKVGLLTGRMLSGSIGPSKRPSNTTGRSRVLPSWKQPGPSSPPSKRTSNGARRSNPMSSRGPLDEASFALSDSNDRHKASERPGPRHLAGLLRQKATLVSALVRDVSAARWINGLWVETQRKQTSSPVRPQCRDRSEITIAGLRSAYIGPRERGEDQERQRCRRSSA